MALVSNTFAGDPRLEACLVNDSAHLTPGTQGDFVGKVQAALIFVDGADIDEAIWIPRPMALLRLLPFSNSNKSGISLIVHTNSRPTTSWARLRSKCLMPSFSQPKTHQAAVCLHFYALSGCHGADLRQLVRLGRPSRGGPRGRG